MKFTVNECWILIRYHNKLGNQLGLRDKSKIFTGSLRNSWPNLLLVKCRLYSYIIVHINNQKLYKSQYKRKISKKKKF